MQGSSAEPPAASVIPPSCSRAQAPLPDRFVALACGAHNTSTGAQTHFDIRMHSGKTFDATTSNGCNGGYDIDGVTTHEWGHIYGLSHVAEDTHGYQTMSTAINGTCCQQSERTLAWGRRDRPDTSPSHRTAAREPAEGDSTGEEPRSCG